MGASHPLLSTKSPRKIQSHETLWDKVYHWLTIHLTFYRIHVIYFAVVPLIAAPIYYAVSNGDLSTIDSIFMSFSAHTGTGLETILMATQTPGQQALIFVLMFLGSSPTVAFVTILVRMEFFNRKFKEFEVHTDETGKNSYRKKQQALARSLSKKLKKPGLAPSSDSDSSLDSDLEKYHSLPKQKLSPPSLRQRVPAAAPTTTALAVKSSNDKDPYHMGGFPNPFSTAIRAAYHQLPPPPSPMNLKSIHDPHYDENDKDTNKGDKQVNYVSSDILSTGNSQFHALTTKQQEEIGGVEYRALRVLFWVVLVYTITLPLFGFLILGLWLANGSGIQATYATAMEGNVDSVNSTWFAAFQVYSVFHNVGLSLVDASMIPFQRTWGFLLLLVCLVTAGNSYFPVLIRLIIWIMSKVVKKNGKNHETLTFLLDHPRRCFTYLFPAYQTWFLVFILFMMDVVGVASFMLLNIGIPAVDNLPLGTRIAGSMFQSIMVHSGGFASIGWAVMSPAVQVAYMVFMYIGVYPIAIIVRSTNVYESRTLNPFGEKAEEDEADEAMRSGMEERSALGKLIFHIRWQLSFDLWAILLGFFLVCIFERTQIETLDKAHFSRTSRAFAGSTRWHPVKHLALRLLEDHKQGGDAWRRVRGLPVATDRSILLPRGMIEHHDDLASVLSAQAEFAAQDTGSDTDDGK
ncbi:TrkH-domain-containing protein [Meredithblackwellia eburnea MCA 4105]